MKAEELRLGNLIEIRLKFPSGKAPKIRRQQKVDCLDLQEMQKLNSDFVFEPIPLTEEWLLKFGFKEFHKRDWSFGGSCSNDLVHLIYITTYLKNPIVRVDGKDLPHIKYVHQLQNRYFALTGEELKLQDKQNDN